MARTAKRRQQAVAQSTKNEPVAVIYKTAIYARLSREDNLNGSESIENQLEYIKSYLASRPYLECVDIYIDNGFTGTDFDRPNWQRLMEDVKDKKINCIVVKDLSRLGRNYIETGEFLEKICPFFGIRFIAINDNFDTDTAEANGQLSVSLSNIINDYYAKDISRKVTSALKTKMENGEYIGSWEKYGYLKSPENKNQLIVNPETAPVVQMIYKWRSEGISYMGINKKLNDMGIPSPGQYKADRGIVTNNNQKAHKILWNKHMVTEILKDTVYLGHLAQRKAGQCLYAGIPYGRFDEQDWIVVENTHEALISQELFDKVQEINRAAVEKTKANHGKYDYLPKAENIYGKKFTCADCGCVIKLVRSFSTKKDKAYFTFKCPSYAEHGARACTPKKMRKADLDAAVLETIKAQFDLFIDTHEAIVTMEEFEAAKAALRKVRPYTKKAPQADFPFYCAHCGRKLQRTFGNDVHFYCVSPYWDESQENCKSVRWDKTDLENVILETLKAEIAVMQVTAREKKKESASKGKQLMLQLGELKKELENGDSQKVQSYIDYREGRITKEEFIFLRAEREKSHVELQEKIRSLEAEYEEYLNAGNQAAKDSTVADRASKLSDEELKQIMYDAIERVNVSDSQHIEIVWKFDDLFIAA